MIVSSVLILVRTSLVALTGGLVVIRPRLILVTRRLIAIGPGLILVTLRLVAIGRRPISSQQLGAAGRAPRNRDHFAADWASHDLRHCLFPSELARARDPTRFLVGIRADAAPHGRRIL